jgi:hypothetical protein
MRLHGKDSAVTRSHLQLNDGKLDPEFSVQRLGLKEETLSENAENQANTPVGIQEGWKTAHLS